MIFSRLAAGAALLAALGAGPMTTIAYPPTPVRPVVDRYFGHAVTDPYRWLENGADPAVRAWVAKQDALTLAYLHAQPAFSVYRRRVAQLATTSTTRFGLQMAGGKLVYLRQTPPQLQAQLVARDGLAGAERVLYDPKRDAIESVYVSLDGSKVAFTTQVGGAENETLHVVDTATGTLEPDTIPNVGGGTSPTAVVWDGDGKGFLHTLWPKNPDGTVANTHIELWHHALGTAPSSDTYVFGRGLSARAEYALLGSADGKYQAITETDGDGVHESIYTRAAGGTFARVATPADAIGSSGDAGAAYVGDRLMVISAKRFSRAEVVAIAPNGSFDTGTVVVPAGSVTITGVTPVRGGFLTNGIDGGDSVVRFVRASGRIVTLPIPPVSFVSATAGDVNGNAIIVGYANYTTPSTWLRYNTGSNTLAPTGIATKAPGDYSKVVVRRVLVPALDGSVRIPVELTYLPGITHDGTAPTILYAYGAYGLVTHPSFLGTLLAFLERGGVYAVAMVRGGGEYGEQWHLAAKLATKTRSSDDLAAAAAWLGSHGYGNARHLGILGGSAGGFLMGLALTRDPGRYRAVDAAVGDYDLLRDELTPNGAYNTPEFGTVTDPAQFAWMVKQSPYERVVRGRAYPAVLMTTGENDPRVDPYNSRKMIARLQASSSSGYPVLLLQQPGQGHGILNSFAQRVDGQTVTLTWFDSQLRG